jgi:hypothetical protein
LASELEIWKLALQKIGGMGWQSAYLLDRIVLKDYGEREDGVRKLFGFFGLLLLAGLAHCAPAVVEAPFELNTGYTTGPASISCSSSAWTSMGNPVSGTYGTFFKNLDGNTGNIRMIATGSSSAPSAATTTWTWSMAPSANAMYLGGAGYRVYYWCVTSHTAAETATVTQVKPLGGVYP